MSFACEQIEPLSILKEKDRQRPADSRATHEAFKRDIPQAVVRFFDTGHFALETHSEDIARAMGDFWNARFVRERREHTNKQ